MAIANAGQVTVEFVAETQKAIGEVKKFGTSLKDTESNFVSLEKVGRRLATVFSGAVIAGFAKQAFAAADATADAAERAGIAVDSFSRLQFAASQADVEMGALTSGVQRFQVTLSKANAGSQEATATLARFGIQAREIADLPLEQQLAAAAEAFQRVTDPADRTRLAVELFGRSAGPQLVPLLRQGAAGIKELADQADRLGITLTEGTARGIEVTDQAVKKLIGSLQAIPRDAIAGVANLLFPPTEETDRLVLQLEQLRRERQATIESNAFLSQLATGSSKQARLREVEGQISVIEQRLEQARRDVQLLESTRTVRPDLVQEVGLETRFSRIDTDAAEGAALDAEINAAKFQRAADFEREMAELRVSSAKAVNEQVLADTTAYLERQNQIVTAAVENEARIKQEAAETEKQLRNSVIDQAIGTFTLLAATSKKGAKIQKGIAAANAARNTHEAVTKALTAGGPFAIPAAIAIGAFGFAQVAAILRTNDSGGGLSPVSGGGRGFSNVAPSQQTSDQQPFGATSRDTVQVIINGNIFSSRETADWIIEQIGEAVERDQFPFSPSSRFSQQIREGGA